MLPDYRLWRHCYWGAELGFRNFRDLGNIKRCMIYEQLTDSRCLCHTVDRNNSGIILDDSPLLLTLDMLALND